MRDLLKSGLWAGAAVRRCFTTCRPRCFSRSAAWARSARRSARELGPLIRYNAKVVEIHQDERGVSATFEDTAAASAGKPPGRLVRLHHSAVDPRPDTHERRRSRWRRRSPRFPTAATSRWACNSSAASGKRTNRSTAASPTPICRSRNIGYPSTGLSAAARACCWARYIWDIDAMEFTAMPPDERVRKAVEYGSQIHPQYTQEFDNGVAVAWHRAPFAHGLLRPMDRSDARAALRQSVPLRRPHRARRRARLVPSGVAGRRRDLGAGCHRPTCTAGHSLRRRPPGQEARHDDHLEGAASSPRCC